jgi:hypothetical protein
MRDRLLPVLVLVASQLSACAPVSSQADAERDGQTDQVSSDPASIDQVEQEAYAGAGTSDDPCLSQCELRAESCEEQPLGSFAEYGVSLAEPLDCGETLAWEVAGQCADGTRFLSSSFSEGALVHYFDGATGAFIALATLTDTRSEPCRGVGYWPVRVDCVDPVVTEPLCSQFYQAGDPVWDLPQ